MSATSAAGRPRLWWLAAIVPVAGGLLILLHGFDGLYGQDPFAYHDYALGPVRDSLSALRPPPPFFWPPGYPVLVALISFPVGPTPFAGQLVSLIAGGAVPLFTALLARELWPNDPRTGSIAVVAGLAAAFNGQLWQSSTVVMSDTTALALAAAGIWQVARYARCGRAGNLILASALLAAATATRWIYGLVAVPAAACALLLLARRSDLPRAVRHGAAAAGAATLLLAPLLWPTLTGAAAFTGNFEVYSWSPLRMFGREFTTVDGTLRHDWPNLIYYGLAPFRWAYFTPLLAPLIVPGIVRVARTRATTPGLLVLGWAAVVLLFHLGAPYQNFRFTLAFLPPLAILVGAGWAEAADLIERRARRARAVLLAFTAAGLLLMAAAGAHTTRVLIDRKDQSLAVVRWTEQRLPPRARLFTFGLTLTFRHYSAVEAIDLFEINGQEMLRRLATDAPSFVLVQPATMEGQWRDASPGANYRLLVESGGLTEIDARGGWHLFRIENGSHARAH